MLLEPITRTMIKIGLIILCAYNVTVAQSQQVTMEIAMVFDVPYVGPINREQKIIFGPNMRHSIETTKAERFYARMFVNESKGKIIDNNSNKYWKYDIEDKEYWAVPFEKALYKKDTTTTEDDDDPVEDISRTDKNDVVIFGKQSNKWVTTFTSAKGNRLILEEWSVSELPALRLADSLNRALELELGKPDSIITPMGKGVSSMMINIRDVPYKLDQIPGEIIKASIKSYKKDERKPNFSMGIKITRLDSETLNMNNFRVPKEYISIKK